MSALVAPVGPETPYRAGGRPVGWSSPQAQPCGGRKRLARPGGMRPSMKGARGSVSRQPQSRAAVAASSNASAGRKWAGLGERLAMAWVAYGKGRDPR